MAFAIEYPTYIAGPYKFGQIVTLYVPDCRRLIGARDGVHVLDGRGNMRESHHAGSGKFALSSEIIIYPLTEGENPPVKDNFPDLD
ncbi:hypothetical protein HY949_03215 [Candidatus Gottesmanbacteria bacterium]|nr:hypothetical protein [Candidatus Gottesmanbacteria bacterium]